MFYRKRAFETECVWRRYSGALSIKPLEGSRLRLRQTRSMGIQSIWAWKSLQRRELREKLVIDARQCTAPRTHCVMVRRGCPSFKSAETLATYTRGSVRRASGFVQTSYPEVIPSQKSSYGKCHCSRMTLVLSWTRAPKRGKNTSAGARIR